MGKKDLEKLRQARAEKARASKTALDQLNALLAKDDATNAEKAQITTFEAQVDILEPGGCCARRRDRGR